jgi:hypothetical protein
MPELEEGQIAQPQQDAVPTPEQQVVPSTEVINPDHSFSWQASEYVFHEKPHTWYLILFGLAIGLGAGLLLLKQWLSVVVVAVMTLAVLVWSKKAPRVLDYHLDDHGIIIQGKSYPYSQFKSFSVQQDVAWRSVDLEPAKRLMPRLTLLCENDDLNIIESILANHLPRHDREPDFIERITRAIKF